MCKKGHLVTKIGLTVERKTGKSFYRPLRSRRKGRKEMTRVKKWSHAEGAEGAEKIFFIASRW